MFGQHRGLEVPPDSHYDSPRKRVEWRKAPSADISSTQPRWDPATDIGRYQSLLIVALHTPVSTRVPELLAEKEPIRTFVEASIKSHCSNAQFARKMASPSVAHRLQDHINRVISAGQPLVYAAQRDPTNRQKHQVVVDLVQQCFTGIRCVDKLTNAEGVLRSEAERLKKLVATLKITNPLDYVADVDVAGAVAAASFFRAGQRLREGAARDQELVEAALVESAEALATADALPPAERGLRDFALQLTLHRLFLVPNTRGDGTIGLSMC